MTYDIDKAQIESVESEIKNLVNDSLYKLYGEINIVLHTRKLEGYYFSLDDRKLVKYPNSVMPI